MSHPHDDLLYWLAAVHLPGIRPLKFCRWLNQFLDIKSLFLASHAELYAAGLSSKEIQVLQQPDWQAAEKDIAWGQQPGCHILTLADGRYPPLLREIADAPLVLYARGEVALLSKPQFAIVGSRHPTPTGKNIAADFAHALAQAGLIITSGMALGIDAAGHRGALIAHSTIAVAGTGLNVVYPPSHQHLAAEIAAKGVLVSEFYPDTPAMTKNFPRRNRLISGMSLGVLVVEAALRSGSLISARFALEQGREVFAVPGSIHNPLARGCHQLIQQGAKLVETATDILEELGPLYQFMVSKPLPTALVSAYQLSSLQLNILANVGHEATALETIIVRSGLTAAEVSSMLLQLELRGYVAIVPGGYVLSP